MSDGVDLDVGIVQGTTSLQKVRKVIHMQHKTGTVYHKPPRGVMAHTRISLVERKSVTHVSFVCSPDCLVARLIEHGVRDKDHALDGQQDLKQT